QRAGARGGSRPRAYGSVLGVLPDDLAHGEPGRPRHGSARPGGKVPPPLRPVRLRDAPACVGADRAQPSGPPRSMALDVARAGDPGLSEPARPTAHSPAAACGGVDGEGDPALRGVTPRSLRDLQVTSS